jgi:hypothetical protein
MAETRVDLLHLLEDLRDAYAGSLEETIVVELVANALDSGARSIALETSPAERSFTVTDDGSGMKRPELRRFHDIAASTKVRGQGIGFAGVGVKLGLLAAEEVLTETRRGRRHFATSWRLAGRHRAPWRWTPPPGLVGERGTAVRLRLHNPLSPLLDPGFLEATIERTFAALLDPAFDELLGEHYREPIRFLVNGRALERRGPAGERAPLAMRLGRRRRPAAVGYLLRSPHPVHEARRGLGISTLGKLIRGGWDWLGLAPGTPEHISGLVEAPGLAECLTLNKADFIRVGRRGAVFLAYRKAIQEVVSAQLARWGDVREAADEARRRRARPVERDLERVLLALADEFPLLASLVERRRGGQAQLAMGGRGRGDGGDGPGLAPLGVAEPEPGALAPGRPAGAPEADTAPPGVPPEAASAVEPEPPAPPPAPVAQEPPAGPGPGGRQPGRYGLAIGFASRPDDPEISRLVDTTAWVNEAHPAYRRAAASRSEGYHLALAVAMALAAVAVEPKDAHAFVTTFLGRWGEAIAGRPRRGRPRR